MYSTWFEWYSPDGKLAIIYLWFNH